MTILELSLSFSEEVLSIFWFFNVRLSIRKGYQRALSLYLLVETASPLFRSVLVRSSSQISAVYPDRYNNERERDEAYKSRATRAREGFPNFEAKSDDSFRL